MAGRRTLGLFALALTACRGDSGYAEVSIDDPWGRWAREGYVELVTAAHAPSSHESVDQVEIWCLLPEGSKIAVTDGPNGPTLNFPPGSKLDRVEFAGTGERRRVIDVRGTTIDETGRQHFHVFRKQGAGRGTLMFGFEWPRDDPRASAAATEAFVSRLRKLPPGSKMEGEKLDGYLGRLRAKNECAGCHPLDRAANETQGEHGLVNRGTDASGFFSPLAVMRDTVAVERYGAHDLNVPDPFVTVRCGASAADVADDGKPRCGDRVVPTAELDVRAGQEAEDPRVLAVCGSRRFLFDHLDAHGQRVFAADMAACESGKPAP